MLGFLLHGFSLTAALTLLWGGLVRIFFIHHVTWSINSVCHFFGRRRFDVEDKSTNVFWLAIPTFGESWHHNHHAFPRSAVHGLGRWEVDISGLVIRARSVGLAHNVVRISPERQAQKSRAASASRSRPSAAGSASRGYLSAAAQGPDVCPLCFSVRCAGDECGMEHPEKLSQEELEAQDAAAAARPRGDVDDLARPRGHRQLRDADQRGDRRSTTQSTAHPSPYADANQTVILGQTDTDADSNPGS